MSKKKESIVAVQVMSNGVLAAEITGYKTNTPHLSYYSFAPMPSGIATDNELIENDKLAEVLTYLWKKGEFSTKKVILCLHSKNAVIKEHQLPNISEKKLRKNLAFEFDEGFFNNMENPALDFYPMEVSDNNLVSSLVVAVPQEKIEQLLFSFSTAGLIVEDVDVSSFGLDVSAISFLKSNDNDECEGAFVVINIGSTNSEVIVVRNGILRLSRTSPYGTHITPEPVFVAGKPGAYEYHDDLKPPEKKDVENILNTLYSTIDFYERKKNFFIEKVLITGEGSIPRSIKKHIPTSLRKEVEVLDIESVISTVKMRKKMMRDDFVESFLPALIGVGMRGLTT